ncbi:MAG: UDP-N-acetylmuramoyl-L-alanine--D-glutamate ligase [Chloroflexi bacterium]|nr:UDP-N-acetylmuramoyl-L-alanine--D-glutamate ligase [Chloroflexota bacterium]
MTDSLEGKKIVILGLARQGIALAEWLADIGAKPVVSDLRTEEQLLGPLKALRRLPIEFVLGGHPLTLLDGASMVCLSGGVPPQIPFVQEAAKRGIKISNDAQLFIERAPCDVIGITGSAGKTTSTSLVGKMFDETDRLAWVGGNIGNPLITDLPYIRADEIAVMELSSFQLEIMTTSPRVAAILNITPNHLDRHKTMEAYIRAKRNIIDHQIVGDVAVLGYDDPVAASLTGHVQASMALFSAKVPIDVGAWLEGDQIVVRPRFEAIKEPVCRLSEIPLRGSHNVLNVLAACAIAGVAGVPTVAMRAAILTFKPVPHRLQPVGEVKGATYVNDSIATAPERVVAALHAFTEPLILLLGGRDKDLPWDDMLTLALKRSRAIITFGEAGSMIADKVDALNRRLDARVTLAEMATLEDAVAAAHRLAQPGDVVLLSPGGTSFDAYADFEQRGEHFRQLVEILAM